MPTATHLLVIDPQNDFCDLPADWCGTDPATGAAHAPALPVPGAHDDMRRLAAFIDRHRGAIDELTVTLDSHHRHDIAHPGFWRGRDGAAVPPFTTITAAQVRAGDFAPAEPTTTARVLAYLDALEARGRYTLMVWPVHCQLGSWGHAVHPAVQAACSAWEDAHGRPVQHVIKGCSPWTEHYSAVQAEVPLDDDPDTQLNQALLQRLDGAALLLIAGEAGSHCVKASTEHLVQHLPGGHPERLVLLTDAISPVAGFEAAQAGFLAAMRAHGVRTLSLDEAARALPGVAHAG
ncbi:cysteine hydrolase [Ideonella sp. A 288]|uniref:cysteine hydrolase n=1 Tax=Ideonella sp. A 288 TaxID=1962181 RepID=UPI000B4AD2D9|nr:cysteine hydrolase [Ideonella sp. A 288]